MDSSHLGTISLDSGLCARLPYERRARAACEVWMEAEGEAATLFEAVLEPRAGDLRGVIESLEPYRRRNSPSNAYAVFFEDLWELYALSRLHDLTRAAGAMDSHRRFWLGLGFEEEGERPFSPLHHEIVSVARDDAIGWPLIEEQVWPCLKLGQMIFARAGVRIRAPRRLIHKEVAEGSTLFWAWQRERPHEDCSHGWGHNSQWRTELRRDYDEGSAWFFNVDAGGNEAGRPMHRVESRNVEVPGTQKYFAEVGQRQSDGLPPEVRSEILWHRCRVRSSEPPQLWIYDDACAMPAGPLCI